MIKLIQDIFIKMFSYLQKHKQLLSTAVYKFVFCKKMLSYNRFARDISNKPSGYSSNDYTIY